MTFVVDDIRRVHEMSEKGGRLKYSAKDTIRKDLQSCFLSEGDVQVRIRCLIELGLRQALLPEQDRAKIVRIVGADN